MSLIWIFDSTPRLDPATSASSHRRMFGLRIAMPWGWCVGLQIVVNYSRCKWSAEGSAGRLESPLTWRQRRGRAGQGSEVFHCTAARIG